MRFQNFLRTHLPTTTTRARFAFPPGLRFKMYTPNIEYHRTNVSRIAVSFKKCVATTPTPPQNPTRAAPERKELNQVTITPQRPRAYHSSCCTASIYAARQLGTKWRCCDNRFGVSRKTPRYLLAPTNRSPLITLNEMCISLPSNYFMMEFLRIKFMKCKLGLYISNCMRMCTDTDIDERWTKLHSN